MIRRELHSIAAIVEYYANGLVFKAPSSVVQMAIQPVSFIFLIYIVSGGQFLLSAVVGALVSFVVGVGITDVPIEISGLKRRSKFYELFTSLPVSTVSLALGIAVGQSLPGLLYAILLIGYLFATETPTVLTALASVGVVFTIWVWSVAIGFYLGDFLEKPVRIRRYSSIVNLGLTTIVPVYYPATLLPDPLQPIAIAVPTASGAYLIRYLYQPVQFRWIPVVSLGTFTLVAVVLGCRGWRTDG
jgi:ABC-2 type transport system permease protein